MADSFSWTQDRRRFLESLGLASTGLVAGGLLAAGYSATAAGFAANEEISIGCIGVGGRCQRLMQALAQIKGVRQIALCDVWDAHLEKAKPLAEAGAFVTKNYHELLARDDLDAVVIGAPDHWHSRMAIDALAAGKHVYVEKPLTHDISQGAAVIEAEQRLGKIVQVGMQQRSMPQFQKAREIVRSGQLGKIHKVHLTWNRNTPRHQRNKLGVDPASVDWKSFLGSAPEQPFDEYRFRNWRWFWDFGGGILTDLMVHYIDVANWFLELGEPASAVTIGDHFMTAGLWETPDTIQTLIRYPGQETQVYFEGTFSSARNGAMLEFMGTEATLYLDRGRYEIHPERNKPIAYSEMVIGEGPRGADFYAQPDGELLHLSNWIECIRSGARPNAPAAAGVSAVQGAHLGNLAYRRQGAAQWSELLAASPTKG